MGVLGCTYTYNMNFILKPFTNRLCLCNLYLPVINNQRISSKSPKYNFLCFGHVFLSAYYHFGRRPSEMFSHSDFVNKSTWPQRGPQRGYASRAHLIWSKGYRLICLKQMFSFLFWKGQSRCQCVDYWVESLSWLVVKQCLEAIMT